MALRRALISVNDKSGVAEFARGLVERGIEVVAADGTERYLKDEGVEVSSVQELIGAKALVGAGLETIHPDLQQAITWGASKAPSPDGAPNGNGNGGGVEFDIVVLNLNPFERVAARRDAREDDVVAAIDIDGPAILRSAAKNFERVIVVADPEVYPIVIEELDSGQGDISYEVRKLLASRAFDASAHYELAIANWFSEVEDFPTYLLRDYVKMMDLPYGENPHQRAAYYVEVGARRHLLSMSEQIAGADLTFNNLEDLHIARGLLADFTIPTCVIVKHGSPIGVSVSGTGASAFEHALSSDETSAYGGVIAMNRPVDEETAKAILSRRFQMLFAPGYTDEARALFAEERRLRVLIDHERRTKSPGERDMRRVVGGLLVQDTDSDLEEREMMDVVTDVHPTEKQWGDLLFAWRVAKWVPSNAAVLARELTTVGIGGTTPSRYDSIEFALKKAGDRAQGSMLATDAFFAYADGPQLAADSGIAGIIQPGGSNNDDEIVELANKAGIPMIFTHRRHIRH
jgi:phosphoribosylaminoimidazolecarboxamide formyltransferase/IMP cyclohydrolase